MNVPVVGAVATPLRIGRKEFLTFPDWNVRLRAKVDTGAFSSVLDVAEYELDRDDTGRLVARLALCLSRRHPQRQTVVFAPVVKMVGVTSSCGWRQERPLLEATVRLGPVEKVIRMTVTNRAHMRCRTLLGREALAGAFVVDVSHKYLLRSDSPELRK
jgi:ribosomal protein S6--L-glutamate ligase